MEGFRKIVRVIYLENLRYIMFFVYEKIYVYMNI